MSYQPLDKAVHRRRNAYVKYNNPREIEYLDQNNIDAATAVVFPAHLYSGNALPAAHFITGGHPFEPAMRDPNTRHLPRDTETHYIIGKERASHPPNFSRFGYARTKYGYSEQRPGTYVEPDEDCNLFLPEDMAPSRFYTDEYSGHSSVLSQAQIDYANVMNSYPKYPLLQQI